MSSSKKFHSTNRSSSSNLFSFGECEWQMKFKFTWNCQCDWSFAAKTNKKLWRIVMQECNRIENVGGRWRWRWWLWWWWRRCAIPFRNHPKRNEIYSNIFLNVMYSMNYVPCGFMLSNECHDIGLFPASTLFMPQWHFVCIRDFVHQREEKHYSEHTRRFTSHENLFRWKRTKKQSELSSRCYCISSWPHRHHHLHQPASSSTTVTSTIGSTITPPLPSLHTLPSMSQVPDPIVRHALCNAEFECT